MRLLRPAVPVLLFLIPATFAAAQEAGAPSPSLFSIGERLRVVSTSQLIPLRGLTTTATAPVFRTVGTVERVESGRVTLNPQSGPSVEIPLSSITAIDVSVGRERRWREGLLGGLAVGAAMGLGAQVDRNDCGPESAMFCSRGEAVLSIGLVVGGVSALVGAFVKGDRWDRRWRSED
jgi:hypothetical protein